MLQRFTSGLLHGDYHLSNVMYRHDGAELAAIVVWELATVGDPLLDMGWIMALWPDSDGLSPSEMRMTPWSGFASIDELVAHYKSGSSRDIHPNCAGTRSWPVTSWVLF